MTAGGDTPEFPSTLFASGEEGVWFDPSDLSTLCQTSGGTSGNVSVGDPVGRIDDKSGNGHHATQTTAASRPVLRQDASSNYYLEFDGSNDWLSTTAIDFTATDQMTVFAGEQKGSDAATAVFTELSATVLTNNGGFVIFAPVSAAATYSFASKGTAQAIGTTAASYAAPITNVLTAQSDISALQCTLRVNAVAAASSASSQGTGNYGNHALYIGRRGGTSLTFTGRLYSLIVRGAETSDPDRDEAEAWVADKTGVTL